MQEWKVKMNRKILVGKHMESEQKYAVCIALFYCVISLAIIIVVGVKSTRYASSSVYQLSLLNENIHKMDCSDSLSFVSSGQRVVDYQVLTKKRVIPLYKGDYENLLKIVEAEAGCEDEEGKLLVANVVINRVQNEAFPNTVTEVIYQKEQGITQFSPISNGRFKGAEPTEKTKEVVEKALMGENHAEGALYFAARDYAEPDRMAWFDTNLTYLFTHGGHEFFK